MEGLRWFEETLADADHAINAMMWQGCARTGWDHWSFSKSPEHGEVVDPTGKYIHCWIPELAEIAPPYCHRPWDLGEETRSAIYSGGGKLYPARCVLGLEERKRLFRGWIENSRDHPGKRQRDSVNIPNFGRVEIGTQYFDD